MTEHANTPELRFPEFTEEWEITLLGEVSYITKLAGFEFTKYVNYSNEGKIPAIRGINIKNGRFNFEDVKYIDDSDFSKLSRSKLLPQDIVFTYVGTIGHAAIVPNDTSWYLAPNVAKIRSTNVYPDFLLQILTNPTFKRKEIFSWITTSSQPALSMANIRNFKLYLPSILEQKKVGIFFSKLDQQIELEEKKLELLEQQKKGYMQKIFSQELRFKDEIGKVYPKWNLKKLKDIANVYQPQNLSQNKFQEKGYPVYGANGVIGYYKEFNHSNMEIAIACRGNTCGRVNLTEPKSWITSNAMVVNIIDKNEIDFYFLYQYLRIINYNNVISGSGQPQITRKNMNSIELLVPKYVEQQKIGAFLTKYEELIKKQSSKVGLLKRRKQGLLQKMFV
ncbi:restriction endonuclease subunit S [Staphylococcus hominis]|uniref:restriction endonuclease subunit S n=1 Tax=Staphylococcus hominis TaxID=1290 RepID=UPI0034D63FC1